MAHSASCGVLTGFSFVIVTTGRALPLLLGAEAGLDTLAIFAIALTVLLAGPCLVKATFRTAGFVLQAPSRR